MNDFFPTFLLLFFFLRSIEFNIFLSCDLLVFKTFSKTKQLFEREIVGKTFALALRAYQLYEYLSLLFICQGSSSLVLEAASVNHGCTLNQNIKVHICRINSIDLINQWSLLQSPEQTQAICILNLDFFFQALQPYQRVHGYLIDGWCLRWCQAF